MPRKNCFMPENPPTFQGPLLTSFHMNLPLRLASRKKGSSHIHPETCFPEDHVALERDLKIVGNACNNHLQAEDGHIGMQVAGKGADVSKSSVSPEESTGKPTSQASSHGFTPNHYSSTEVHLDNRVTSTTYVRSPAFEDFEGEENFNSDFGFQANGETSLWKRQGVFCVLKRAHSEIVLNNEDGKLPVKASTYKCLDLTVNKAGNISGEGPCLHEESRSNSPHEDLSLSQHHRSDSKNTSLTGRLQRPRILQGDTESMVVKAIYKENTVHFRLPLKSGFSELHAEVAKRFKIESGAFDLKYLDDEYEWVLLACDADLQECIDILNFSGGCTIKIVVHGIFSNIGSLCESSGEL
eukprot:Gb_31293 [translate_table: standard]